MNGKNVLYLVNRYLKLDWQVVMRRAAATAAVTAAVLLFCPKMGGQMPTLPKGQIISKGLFGVLEFSQKMNERIRRSSKNEFFRSFFGRIRGYQESFRNYLTFSKMRSNLQ